MVSLSSSAGDFFLDPDRRVGCVLDEEPVNVGLNPDLGEAGNEGPGSCRRFPGDADDLDLRRSLAGFELDNDGWLLCLLMYEAGE